MHYPYPTDPDNGALYNQGIAIQLNEDFSLLFLSSFPFSLAVFCFCSKLSREKVAIQ